MKTPLQRFNEEMNDPKPPMNIGGNTGSAAPKYAVAPPPTLAPSEPAGDLVERMLEKLLTMTNFEAAAKACAEIAQQECQNKAVGFADWSVQSPYARFGPDKWGLGDGTFITTADLYSEYLKTNPAQ